MNAERVHKLFLIVAVVACAYAIIFPLLTVDTMRRMIAPASAIEPRNLLLVIFLELSRLISSVIGIAIAIGLIARSKKQPAARPLALFLLFSVITLEKVFGSNGYPGKVQESVAIWLIDAGVPTGALAWLFGDLAWPVWLAAAALLRFSVVMPEELAPATLDLSAREDRRGFMRAKGAAGADIGALFRNISRWLFAAGAYQPLVLTVAALLFVVMHTLGAGKGITAVFWVVAIVVLCVVVTNLRAAYLSSRADERARMAWIIEALVLAMSIFIISTTMLVVIPTAASRMVAFLLMMLVPATVMAALALSVADRGQLDAQVAVEKTVRVAVVAFALTLTFGLLFMVLGVVAERLGMSRAVGALVAAVAVTLGFEWVKQSADRVRLRVLER